MLLEARKTPSAERGFALYGRHLLRRSFARVRIGGVPWPGGDGPAIAFANHSSWWDPIVTFFLSGTVLQRDGYGLMQGAQLLRYPFFRRIGCFGASTSAVADARAVAAYASAVLGGGERRVLWIFPQGELAPARAPLTFRSGAARLARAVPQASLVPVAIRYELRGEQRPECFIRVGEAVRGAAVPEAPSTARAGPAARLTRELEERLRRELHALDADLLGPDVERGYNVALEGRGSLSAFYDRTLGRLDRVTAHSRESPGTPNAPGERRV